MTRPGNPQSRLAALLDALEREILAAQTDEMRGAWRGTGRARNIALQEVRALLDEAIAASEEGPAATLPPDTRTGLDPPLDVSRQLRAAPRGDPHPNAFPAWSRRHH
jgi:hypothetical protein